MNKKGTCIDKQVLDFALTHTRYSSLRGMSNHVSACVYLLVSVKSLGMITMTWTEETIHLLSWNLLVQIQKTEWWISHVNVGEGHFFSSLSFRLSRSEKRGGFENLPSLLHRAAEKKELAFIAVITLQLCNSDICPTLKHIHLYLQTTCILRTAGYGCCIFTYKNISVTRRWHSFYYRDLLHMDKGACVVQ